MAKRRSEEKSNGRMEDTEALRQANEAVFGPGPGD